jgi:hypothetical protein
MPLPEHTEYRDTGCNLHAACLTCPFERCRYDAPRAARVNMNADRDREIVRLFLAGVPPVAIGRRVALTERSVFRIASSMRQRGRAA